MARPKKGITFWDRVWTHTVRTENGCLEFHGHRNADGYGKIWKDGYLVLVHREAWKKFRGPIPRGKQVLHSCDNPCCWEPAHLWTGTHAENMEDKAKKGRVLIKLGQDNRSSKLRNNDVRRIKRRLAAGATCAELARLYGVSEGNVRHIKKGRKWQHIS